MHRLSCRLRHSRRSTSSGSTNDLGVVVKIELCLIDFIEPRELRDRMSKEQGQWTQRMCVSEKGGGVHPQILSPKSKQEVLDRNISEFHLSYETTQAAYKLTLPPSLLFFRLYSLLVN
jgi:hypothetical protein